MNQKKLRLKKSKREKTQKKDLASLRLTLEELSRISGGDAPGPDAGNTH